jgi:hypothetical protein
MKRGREFRGVPHGDVKFEKVGAKAPDTASYFIKSSGLTLLIIIDNNRSIISRLRLLSTLYRLIDNQPALVEFSLRMLTHKPCRVRGILCQDESHRAEQLG